MANLKIFTDNIEDKAREQINELMSQPAFKDAKIRIMPDVHAGKGCVIGFTGDIGNKVIPNIVGVDIGCGMLTVNLEFSYKDINFKELDEDIRRLVPSGRNVHETQNTIYAEMLKGLYCYDALKNWDYILKSVGTLGGGNHFIEIDTDRNDNAYLVIHSGSRNLGKQVAEYYQKRAIEYHSIDLKTKKKELIEEYKLNGRSHEIQTALIELSKTWKSNIPDNLAYLEGELRDEYLHDMEICQRFAHFNRCAIASNLLGVDVNYYEHFTTIHNYIDFETNIVRKGAISARAGEKVLIPLNMRDGCILGVGKGNPDWNYSAPHGAGRLMSRNEAKKNINVDDFNKSMEGIYTTCVGESTLDESPFAYKPAQEIVEKISDTVDIIEVLKPVYNFKATEV